MNKEIKNDSMVLVNIIELASELSHRQLVMIMIDNDKAIYKCVDGVYTEYTDEAQEIYNRLYDKYYNIISKCK